MTPNARFYLISNKDNEKYKKSEKITEIHDLLEIIEYERGSTIEEV